MRLRTLIFLLILFLCCITSVAAQDVPDSVFEAAVRAAKGAKPGLGASSDFKWQRLNPTKLSNLDCPLVQGLDLGREVTPYAVSLTYPDGVYIVHVSADGTLAQPCDPKFGALVASTPAPPSGCQLAAASQPTFRIAPDASTAVLGGEVMVNGIAYAIGRTDTKDWYQTRNNANQIGWVSAKEVTINGNAACDPLPITGAQNIDYVTGTCFITAAQDFSNVRQKPDANAPVLSLLYENIYFQVYATTTDGQWLFINPGWVADRVTEKYGECSSLQVNNDLVGVIPGTPTPTPAVAMTSTPFMTSIPTMTFTPVATATALPAAFTCPTDFKGFLAPRITLGAATARVGTGGSPNRLRAEPTVTALQVGQAQPGRTLDKVLSGAACNGTFVWWFVEIDGVQGWTAESDSTDAGTYFLEPVGAVPTIATAVPTVVIGAATAAPTAVMVQPTGGSGLLQTMTFERPEPIRDLRFAPDNTLLTLVQRSLYASKQDVAAAPGSSLAENIIALDTTVDRLYALDAAGTLHVYALNTLTEVTKDAMSLGGAVDTPTFSVNSDGRYFLTVGCNDTACKSGKIDLWDIATGKVIRSQPAHQGQPYGAAFTPDDKRIVSWGKDGVQVWDTQTGQFVFAQVGTTVAAPALPSDLPIMYTAVCDEPKTETTCGHVGIAMTSLETQVGSVLIEPATSSIPTVLVISIDNKWLALAVQDGTIFVYNMDAGGNTPAQTFVSGMVISSLAFNADAKQLAAGSTTGTAQVWGIPQP